MNNNLPSIIQCSSNSKCFYILDEILFIGNDKGFVEIFDWKKENKLFEIDLYSNKDLIENKEKDNNKQIINISLLSKEKFDFLIQSRGGEIFIGNIDIKNLKYKQYNKIETQIESFTKFKICFNEEIRKSNKKYVEDFKNENWKFSIITPNEKENEIKIYEISNNYLVLHGYIKKLFFSNEEENNDSDSDSSDNGNAEIRKSLICNIIIKESKNIIIFAFESSTIGIYNLKLEHISHLKLFKEKEEAIITTSLFEFNNEIFICVGFFSPNLLILKLSKDYQLISKYKNIKNACSDLKQGISSIIYGEGKREDLLSEENEINKFNILFIGSYDKRVKLFNLNKENNEITFTDIGNIITNSNGIINQIYFLSSKEKENELDINYYLFVCCEQRLFYIYLIA